MKNYKHIIPNTLTQAWKVYKDGNFLELVAEDIVEKCSPSEVLRVIQIGLLCVQPHPEDRPSMPTVVLMLCSEITLPEPKQPGFFTERIPLNSDSSTGNVHELSLSTGSTITSLVPR